MNSPQRLTDGLLKAGLQHRRLQGVPDAVNAESSGVGGEIRQRKSAAAGGQLSQGLEFIAVEATRGGAAGLL